MIIVTVLATLAAALTALAIGYRWGRTPPRRHDSVTRLIERDKQRERLPEWPTMSPPPVHVVRLPRDGRTP